MPRVNSNPFLPPIESYQITFYHFNQNQTLRYLISSYDGNCKLFCPPLFPFLSEFFSTQTLKCLFQSPKSIICKEWNPLLWSNEKRSANRVFYFYFSLWSCRNLQFCIKTRVRFEAQTFWKGKCRGKFVKPFCFSLLRISFLLGSFPECTQWDLIQSSWI